MVSWGFICLGFLVFFRGVTVCVLFLKTNSTTFLPVSRPALIIQVCYDSSTVLSQGLSVALYLKRLQLARECLPEYSKNDILQMGTIFLFFTNH